jgi:hypothetical protein
MSAFLVGHDHIDALLSFAMQRNRSGSSASYYHESNGRRVDITRENATEIGRILLAENERSINARYPDTVGNPEEMPGTIGEYAANYEFRDWPLSSPLSPVAVLKACSCFDYQACETPARIRRRTRLGVPATRQSASNSVRRGKYLAANCARHRKGASTESDGGPCGGEDECEDTCCDKGRRRSYCR